MDKQIGSSLIGAGANVASGILGMIGQRKREKRAMRNQKELMDIQQKNQMALNEQGHNMQKEMWDYTNYPNQVKAMKEAGLSTGLMYGMSGGGGTTTGSQGGGSAAGGQAPAPQPMPMDIGNAMQAMATAANIELMKANARKAEAEAASIRGEEGTTGASQIAKNIADALNAEAQAKLKGLELRIGEATAEDQIDKAAYEVEELIKRNNLTDEQANLAREQALTQGVERQLKRAQIDLAEGQVNKMVHDIKQGYIQLDNMLKQIEVGIQGNKLRALEGKTDIERIKNDFILGALGKQIDLSKLNIEQQKIFVSMFNSLLGARPTTTTTETWSEKSGGSTSTTTRK